MTELLELAAVAIMKDMDPLECPFRAEEGPPNSTEPSPDGDDDDNDGNATFNDSGTLGDNMGRPPAAVQFPPAALDVKDLRKNGPHLGSNVGVKANPHHLVPGHASLPYSAVAEFMGDATAVGMPKKAKDKGKVSRIEKGGIGYDVNDAKNGKWLPSNNALRGNWNVTDTKGRPIQCEYAFLAINKADAAFHDAHTDYNDFCIRLLDALNVKLKTHYAQAVNASHQPCHDYKNKLADKFPHGPYPYLRDKIYGIGRRLGRYLDLSNIEFWYEYELTTSRFNSLYKEYKETNATPTVIDFGDGKQKVEVTDYAAIAVNYKITARR